MEILQACVPLPEEHRQQGQARRDLDGKTVSCKISLCTCTEKIIPYFPSRARRKPKFYKSALAGSLLPFKGKPPELPTAPFHSSDLPRLWRPPAAALLPFNASGFPHRKDLGRSLRPLSSRLPHSTAVPSYAPCDLSRALCLIGSLPRRSSRTPSHRHKKYGPCECEGAAVRDGAAQGTPTPPFPCVRRARIRREVSPFIARRGCAEGGGREKAGGG